MAVHLLNPVAPSTPVPRAHPCQAWIEQFRADCGATPSLLFRKVCGCTPDHARDVRLCGLHERELALDRLAVCRECANLAPLAGAVRAHRCAVTLIRVPEAVDLIRAGRA